jgi:hypothetical protein
VVVKNYPGRRRYVRILEVEVARPAIENQRVGRHIYLNAEEHTALERLVELDGSSASGVVRSLIRREAQRALSDEAADSEAA